MAVQSSSPLEYITLDQWKGLNQQARRTAIDNDEEFWNENLFRIGPGNLRSCWGASDPIYTCPAGTTVVRIFFGFYGNQTGQFAGPPPGAMGWMFLSDGTIDEFDLQSGQTTGLRAAGQTWQPIAPYYWASAKVWRPKFFGNQPGQNGGVLFGSPKGLYAWDGTTLSAPGDDAPDWLTNLSETAPGTTMPMPTGLPGIYCMEVYADRLWVAGKDVISFSAPSNGADFSTTDGGGSFGYFGDKLVYSYVDLAASADFLYCVGDSSIDAIHNVTLTGNGTVTAPFTTNFTYFNVDPQTGQQFPRPLGRFGKYLTAFNGAGIYELQGGEFAPIDDKLTVLWNTLDTSQFYPTFATANIFGFRVLLVNARLTDPFGATRSLILIWHPVKDQEFWSIASQNLDLTNIGHYEQDSRCIPYGTDGKSLYQLFSRPDPYLAKRLSTKFFRGEGPSRLNIKSYTRVFADFWDESIPAQNVSIIGDATALGAVAGGTQGFAFQGTQGGRLTYQPQTLQCQGLGIALDLQSFSPDFTLERLYIAFEERTPWGA